MDPNELKLKLISCIKKWSYKEGDFTLASGKKSRFYINVKATALHPEGANLIGRLVIEKIKKLSWQIDAVAGMTLGADPILTAVSLEAYKLKNIWPAIIVRKEPKGHGTNQFIEFPGGIKPPANVLVLEDVTTTGGSSLRAIKELQKAGFIISGLITIFDREEGAFDTLLKEGINFESLIKLSEIRTSNT